MKKILDKFNSAYEYIEFENISIAVIKNDTENYNFIQYINGLNVYNGGKPIEWVENNLIGSFISLLPKKYDKIKPGDVKNKITLIVIFKNMKNPRFEDQVKSKCINSASMFKDIATDVDFNKLAKQMFKNKDIKTNILEHFDMKADWEAKKALKELNKDKKEDEILYDSYYPATKEKKYLVISEGKSARASQQKALGNFEFGFYELTGVPANVLEMSAKDFKDNKRGMPELYEIINNENYDYVLLGSDADADGAHINGLLIGFIYTYMKDLLLSNKVGFLKMPLIVVRDKKGKLIETLYSISEYQLFLSKNKDISKYVFDYKKGYGSLNGPKEMQEFLDKDGLKKVIDIIEWDESDEEIIETWLSSSADALLKRKEIISSNEFDINKVV